MTERGDVRGSVDQTFGHVSPQLAQLLMQPGNKGVQRVFVVVLLAILALIAQAQAEVLELEGVAVLGGVHLHSRQHREELLSAPGFVVVIAQERPAFPSRTHTPWRRHHCFIDEGAQGVAEGKLRRPVVSKLPNLFRERGDVVPDVLI